MDYFELYKIPVSLKVDKAIILKKYYQLSKKFHPDNFSLEDAFTQEKSLQKSAEINKAKTVLEDANKRLAYILSEKGYLVAEEKYNLSPVFLGEMMDLNEAIMELEMESNENNFNVIKEMIDEKQASLFKNVENYFNMDVLQINEDEYAILKDYYYKQKYIQRIAERINGKL